MVRSPAGALAQHVLTTQCRPRSLMSSQPPAQRMRAEPPGLT